MVQINIDIVNTQMTDQFQARVQWCASRSMVAGRTYCLVYESRPIAFTVTTIKYREDGASGEHFSATKVNLNECAVVNISLAETLIFNSETINNFLIQDIQTGDVLGQGTFDFALNRAANIRWQQLSIDKSARAMQKSQIPKCIWFTGLSGSGKSTIANLLEKRLYDEGLHTYLLDGDNLRHGLNRDLGFTEADRVENIRRVSEVSRLMVDAGLIVIAAFISPYSSERLIARKLFSEREFIEIFVKTSLAECEKRDPKGLYAKARRGELKNFTGIDSVYESPESPEIVLDTDKMTPENCVQFIVEHLESLDPLK